MGLKTISISEDNYRTLKKLGGAGDSFNDVITELIGKEGAIKKGLQSKEM
jgi:predicted CopG family antitoxin